VHRLVLNSFCGLTVQAENLLSLGKIGLSWGSRVLISYWRQYRVVFWKMEV